MAEGRINRILDRAATTVADSADVYEEEEKYVLEYGPHLFPRRKRFDTRDEAINYFNSELKQDIVEPDLAVFGDRDEYRRAWRKRKAEGEPVRSLEGIALPDTGEWAVNVRSVLEDTAPLAAMLAQTDAVDGMSGGIGYKVVEPETDKQYGHPIELFLDAIDSHMGDMEEEFENNLVDFISAATVQTVSQAMTEEDARDIEMYLMEVRALD